LEKFAAVTDKHHAEVSKVFDRQVPQGLGVDSVFSKGRGVLAKP
jgi:hypothetical protein